MLEDGGMAQHINDSNGAVHCWAKYWTQPFTLADCGYGYGNGTSESLGGQMETHQAQHWL